MANFILAYDNRADTATLTGGSWPASYPRANLQDSRVKKKARTADLADTSTRVYFALPEPAYIGAIGLVATNASREATYRARLYNDAAFTSIAYTSGLTELYPAGTIPFGAAPFGSPSAWDGKPELAQLRRFQRNVMHVLSDRQYAQYGSIEIFDTSNSDGYFEAGRLFVGSVFEPQDNPAYGKASLHGTSRTQVTRARDGTPYFNPSAPLFSVPFGLDWLTLQEAMKVLDIQMLADTSGECFAEWDHEDVQYRFCRQVFGHLRQLDAVEHPMFATYAAAFQVEGLIA